MNIKHLFDLLYEIKVKKKINKNYSPKKNKIIYKNGIKHHL